MWWSKNKVLRPPGNNGEPQGNVSHRSIKRSQCEINEKDATSVSVGEGVAVHSTLRAVKPGKVIASFSPDICSNGEMALTSPWVRYMQNKEDLSRSSSVAHPLLTAQMETGRGADPCVIQVRNLVEDDGQVTTGRGHTSPISVRSALAVVGDGWLPVVVTRRTVDPADKKVEKFTARLGDAPSTSSPEPRTVAIGIAGVSPPKILFHLVRAAGVVSLGRLFGHRARVGGGCGNVG